MANQTTPRTSKEWVDQMLREHYQEAREAKKAGRLVCWSTSIAPQELLTTMDIVTVYPENHAAAIGAGGIPTPSFSAPRPMAIPQTFVPMPG